MPPEQLHGEGCDRRSDVFSLGASAFALRYGHPPWADTGELRGTHPPRFPPARTPQEAYFQHVLDRAMARRIDARQPSARHVESALRALATDTRPATATTRVGPGVFMIGETRLVLEVGDIASTPCDTIINSAYFDMSMDTGVGAALRARGGAMIESQAMENGARAIGDCVVTTAGDLPCRAVLHAVGAWNQVSCIARSVWRALLIAERAGYRTIAMPAIGTGKGRVALASCADTLASVIRHHLALGGSRIRELRIVLYDAPSLRTFDEVVTGLLLGTQPDAEPDAECAADAWEGATVFAR